MRVRADERVRVGLAAIVHEHHASQVFEVDLVDDAGVRRNDLEVLEGALSPAQKRIALPVSLELEFGIAGECLPRPEHVDLDGVVDHQLRWD